MIVIGYILIVIAVGWFLYKMYLSYNSAGGTDFAVPVYDGAMYPPILGVFGLFWVLRAHEVNWSYWIYIGVWLASAVLAAVAIRVMEELGDRPLR